MLSSIRKFSTSFMGKMVIGLIAIAFVVGFGMSGSFSGKQNIVAEIDGKKISTQEFIDHLRTLNITHDEMERIGKFNLLERVLNNYISEKIISLESEKKGLKLSDRSLFTKLANDKKFQKDGKFSETRYEKFILTSGLTKPFYENLLKENEIKSQLLNFYSGGFALPVFIIDDLYSEENRSIDIKYISLTKIYGKKLISENQIKDFYEKNKGSFEETQKKFRYLKLSPEILIGSKVMNEEYFKKIDLIENSILDGENFEQLSSNYKDSIKSISFVNSEGIQENGNNFNDIDKDTFKEIFKITEINTAQFVSNKNNYYLVELKESQQKLLDLQNKTLKEKIKNQISLINQIEKIGELISKIDEKKFNNKDFDGLANQNNESIKKLTLKNINDTSNFNSQSMERIYQSSTGSIFILPDENENFLVSIINEKKTKIDTSSKKYKSYINKAKEIYTTKIYRSYDRYINQKYKIDINKNVLKRIENSF